MDKDMMAKINEALKANGRRELSLDELDKVTGGGKLEDMLAVLKSKPGLMNELRHIIATEGKPAMVKRIIDVVQKERPDLVWLANDVIGLIL